MKSFLEKHHITPETRIIIACSGGADSMFLLSEILKIHPKENAVVAHFNHNLRWEESDRDEKFVQKFCEENELTFELWSAQISQIAKEKKLGIEEAARNERYNFLETIRKKHEAK